MLISPISVELIDSMGTDLTVVNAARVSFRKESEKFEERDERLIKYLAEHEHWSPFAHAFLQFHIKAPVFVARQAVKHQVGLCLHGDTEVTFIRHHNGASNNKHAVKIKDLYRMWSGQIKYQGGEKGRRNVYIKNIRVFDEVTQRFKTSHIRNVILSGVKDCYEITDEFGNSVVASEEHPFLTDKGWVNVADLTLDHRLVRDDVGRAFAATVPPNRNPDRVLRNHIRQQATECTLCGSQDDLHSDHILPVSSHPELAMDPNNIQVICKECHHEKTKRDISENIWTTLLPKYVSISSIEYVGRHEVYDLSVDHIHNFLANGFVVHNCWNEVSRRYVSYEPDFFWPDKWRLRPDNIKQGSSENDWVNNLPNIRIKDIDGKEFEVSAQILIDGLVDIYNVSVKRKIAPEQVRMILPQNMMTEWWWSGSLYAFARVCRLRLKKDAQKEIRDLAAQIDAIVNKKFPVSWKCLMANVSK